MPVMTEQVRQLIFSAVKSSVICTHNEKCLLKLIEGFSKWHTTAWYQFNTKPLCAILAVWLGLDDWNEINK